MRRSYFLVFFNSTNFSPCKWEKARKILEGFKEKLPKDFTKLLILQCEKNIDFRGFSPSDLAGLAFKTATQKGKNGDDSISI